MYTLTYLESRTLPCAQKATISTRVPVTKRDPQTKHLRASDLHRPRQHPKYRHASMHTGVVEDVYLTLVSARDTQNGIMLEVRVNPMIV